MRHWTIKKRIIFGFAAILALVGVMGMASFILLRQIKTEANVMNTDDLPGMTAMAQIKGTAGEMQIKVLRAFLAKTPEERKEIGDAIAAARAKTLKAAEIGRAHV
jgi:hypothetical protein